MCNALPAPTVNHHPVSTMEEFAQKVLTVTRTRPIIETLLLESNAPDGLAIVLFFLAAFSGCILLLLKFAPIKFIGGRKVDLGEVDNPLKVCLLLCAVYHLRFSCASHLDGAQCLVSSAFQSDPHHL